MIMAKTAPIVYVVDDDDSVRASLKLLIESSGYPVVTLQRETVILPLGTRHSELGITISLPCEARRAKWGEW